MVMPVRIYLLYDKGSQLFYAVDDEKYLVTGGDIFIKFPGETHGSGGYPERVLYWTLLLKK